MSFDQGDFPSAANLIGNVNVPRNVNPTIRSGVRRSDPDGGSSTPYYPNTSGKFLRLGYSNEVASVVTDQQIDISLSSNSLATIISTINAAAPLHIQASDQDGFLVVKNLNPGKTHYLKIMPYTTSLVDDAAPVLGFEVFPLPGSISFAGEISAAPGSRTQQNPQTTSLITKDSDLTAGEVNRSFASLLQMIENLRAELSRDVIVYKDVALNFSAAGIAQISDDSIRIYAPPITSPTIQDFEKFFRVLNTDNEQAINTAAGYNGIHVTNLFYGSGADTSSVFVAWGTPDGKKATGTTVANKDKHASTTVTSIKGNVVYCASADFVTAKVKAGDPVQLTASNMQPFDHSGWWAVDAVIDSKHLTLRPMADTAGEPAPAAGNKPRVLNPSAGGSLRVAVGRFLPAGDIWIEIDDTTVTNMVVRMPVAVPLREVAIDTQGQGGTGFLDQVSNLLYDHISDATSAHEASAIGGFVSTTPWKNGAFSGNTASIQATIEDIIGDLSSIFGGENTEMLGAQTLTILGAPPNTIASGNLKSQLVALLTLIRDHVNDGLAHAGAGATYSGSPNFADGTNIPAGITIDNAIDTLVAALAWNGPFNGAGKIGTEVFHNWATSPTSSVPGPLYDAINSIIDDLASQTASNDGAHRIGTQVTADLAAGTIRSQLNELATNWGKLNRANTWSAKQTVNGTASDTVAAIDTTYTPTTRKLLWEALLPGGVYKARLYAGQNHTDVGYEVTVNARWDGTNWNKENLGQGFRATFARSGLYIQARLASDGGVWADTLGNWHAPLFINAEAPTATTAMGPSMVPSNVCRSHGFITVQNSGASIIVSGTGGFNWQAPSIIGGGTPAIGITFPVGGELANTNYNVLVTCELGLFEGGILTPQYIITNKTTSGFRIELYDRDTPTPFNIMSSTSVLGTALNLSFVVYGA